MTFDFANLDRHKIATMNQAEFRALLSHVASVKEKDRRENALCYYAPVSETARRIHLSDAQTLGVGGGNGCLPLTSPVLMADGTWKSLGEIVPGDRVIAADPESGRAIPSNVVRTYRSGIRPVYRFTASDGGSFECTLDHRVPLFMGSGKWTTKGNEKKPHKRLMRDYLEAIHRRGARNPSKRIAALSPADVAFEADGKLRIHPYLLGALLGDGSFTGGPTPKFHNTDEAVIERVRGHVEAIGGELRKYAHGCEYGLAKSPLVREELERLGLYGHRDRFKSLPRFLLSLSRRDRMELAAGLVDTDGTRDWFTSASVDLAHGFAALIRSLGGKATIHERSTPSPFGKAWYVYWRMNDRLPLACPRKQTLSKRPPDYQRRVLRSSEFVGFMETGDIEVNHPAHCYVTWDWFIVSNSSKTETCIVEMVMLATGVLPDSLRFDPEKHRPEDRARFVDPKKKFRGPVKCRIVCESLTTVLHTIILPKLKWWEWTGVDEPGGKRGHWGWVPRDCLIGGQWDKSWSEKNRTLTLIYHDPHIRGRVVGNSTIQFMSRDQDATDFASGDFHMILHDEPPTHAIWRENQARTMRVRGRMFLAMTWPDDPSIPVDWLFDEIYEPAQRQGGGPVEWINLYTTDNPHLDQIAVSAQMAQWTDETKNVRIFGRPIRFSNRVHSLFTDQDEWWCFSCGRTTVPNDLSCSSCGGLHITRFNHVGDYPPNESWPTVFLLDPHPRKPHMFLWVQVSPSDDLVVVAEGECAAGIVETRDQVLDVESRKRLHVTFRYIDPNMGRTPANTKNREITWQDEFESVGLRCDLANDSATGRTRIDELLKPDIHTQSPRILFDSGCTKAIHQIKRYVWDDYKSALEKDMKQKPKDKNDDYPTLLKYMANTDPSFHFFREGATFVRRFKPTPPKVGPLGMNSHRKSVGRFR